MRSLHETIHETDSDSSTCFGEKALVVDGSNSTILSSNMSTESLDEWVNFLNNQLPHYSEIVIATDNDRRGAYGAMQIIDRLNTPLPPVHVMLFNATDEINLTRAWNNRQHNSWESSGYDKKANAQKLKRLFDFWWHSNSALVFGELCKKTGLKGDPVISKYEFMAMKLLSLNESGIRESQLHDSHAKLDGYWKIFGF